MNVPLAACGLAPSVLGKEATEVDGELEKASQQSVLLWSSLLMCIVPYLTAAALLRAGFRHQKDLVDVSARELASEAKINVKDAVEAIEIARNEKNSSAVGDTALDLLQEVTRSKPIATRLLGLDGLLGGGLQRGEVTEICRTGCGGPGTGKTQFGIHACLAAQYVANTTDKPSSAIFIDSEGSFIIERVASMATHFLEDFRHIGADKLVRMPC
ncbi:hypothetical protein PPTG_03646 [Phytophthora nicotianae INRA-310]|uniref:DNA repair protein RAD51 homolog 3 n=1 Tax=Phytophthora nicotianae (strain INRA-310) TaxID=761204 RepID=W2R628_PHYN3|nr:hypothetical protein PPTG_03646 [Phytophthora nicotianae INRA-310]ETN20706.1 hypothetical protein PPTG_03646 [Phytophthora nicotianae INRA-310]